MRSTSTNIGILIIRLSIGILMLMHGIFKLMNGIGPIENMVMEAGMPAFFAYGVFIGEVIAPIFLILGLATRAASAVFIINCLTAMVLSSAGSIFTMSSMGGWSNELLGLFMFGALALLFTGGGKFALSKKYMWD